MPRILTVDDSSTIRSIVNKQMTELGFEIEQAEDGQQALAKLEEIEVDLILLDVTMPVMDGPTMLAKLRETGNKTPVIMLTSESKRSIISGAVKLGIDDYILKPFKPEELRAKVLKVMRMDGKPAAAAPETAPAAVAANPSVAATAAVRPADADASRQFVDVLVVDDMETVHKKLRSLLPAHVSMNGCVSAREALSQSQTRVYRVIVVDLVIPDVNSVALMNQLRAVQPHAVMVALALRSANDLAAEVKEMGFQDVLFKPFDTDAVSAFLYKFFDAGDVLTADGNVLVCSAYEGKEDRVERYFSRLKTSCRDELEKLASACIEDAILDLAAVPGRGDKLVRFVIEVEKEGRKLGVALRLVGGVEIKKAIKSIAETAAMPFFDNLAEAKAA